MAGLVLAGVVRYDLRDGRCQRDLGGQEWPEKRPRIDLNVIPRDGLWCNFSLRDGLYVQITNEGIFPMKAQRSLWRVIIRTGGSAGGAHRAPPAGRLRARATLGILVLALMLGSIGTAALTLTAHGSAGHAHVSAVSKPWIL
jgi:hypothetical protein